MLEDYLYELSDYLILFGLTYLLETPVFYLFLRKRRALSEILKISLMLNLATHPLVGIAFPRLSYQMGWDFSQYVAFSEVFAPTVEFLILIFYSISWQVSLPAAIGANVFSWLLGGTVIRYFWQTL